MIIINILLRCYDQWINEMWLEWYEMETALSEIPNDILSLLHEYLVWTDAERGIFGEDAQFKVEYERIVTRRLIMSPRTTMVITIKKNY